MPGLLVTSSHQNASQLQRGLLNAALTAGPAASPHHGPFCKAKPPLKEPSSPRTRNRELPRSGKTSFVFLPLMSERGRMETLDLDLLGMCQQYFLRLPKDCFNTHFSYNKHWHQKKKKKKKANTGCRALSSLSQSYSIYICVFFNLFFISVVLRRTGVRKHRWIGADNVVVVRRRHHTILQIFRSLGRPQDAEWVFLVSVWVFPPPFPLL
jgi:hypothetical protein